MVELVVGVCLGMAVVLMFWLGYALGYMNGRHRGRTDSFYKRVKTKTASKVEAAE